MKKRIVSWLLVLVMVFGMIPVPTHAAETVDYSSNIGKYAKLDMASTSFLVHSNPAAFSHDPYLQDEVGNYQIVNGDWANDAYWMDVPDISDTTAEDYEDNLAKYQQMQSLVMVVEDCCYNSETTGLWYKVKAADGCTLPAFMVNNGYTWIFQTYTDEYEYPAEERIYYDQLILSDPCDKCGGYNCSADHSNWCDICEKDDCGEDHSEPEETTKPSEPDVDNCDKCDDPDCDGQHPNWCDICGKDNCGEDHSEPEETTKPSEPDVDNCDKCDDPDCDGQHPNWCDICEKDNCGEDHSDPADDGVLENEDGTIVVEGELPSGARLEAEEVTVDGAENVFDIKIMKDGEVWQPIDDGVTVTISLPVADVEDGEYVDVYHFIEYAEDIDGDEEIISLEGADAATLALLEKAIDAYEEKYDDRDHVAVEVYEKLTVKDGKVEVKTDSFSVYVLNNGMYENVSGTDFSDLPDTVKVTPGSYVRFFRDDGSSEFTYSDLNDPQIISSFKFQNRIWVSSWWNGEYKDIVSFAVAVSATAGQTFTVTYGSKTVRFEVIEEQVDTTATPVMIAILTDMNADIPPEPAETSGSYYHYTSDGELSRWEAFYMDDNNGFVKETLIDQSGDKLTDPDSEVYGIVDTTGSNKTLNYLNMSEDLMNDIVEAYLSEKRISENEWDNYELIVYVVKFHDNEWHIDCKVALRNEYRLSYDYNPPNMFSEYDFTGNNWPGTVSVEVGQSTTVASGDGFTLVRQIDNTKYTATFVGWNTDPNADPDKNVTTTGWYDGGNPITLNGNTVLYAIWETDYDYTHSNIIFHKNVVNESGAALDADTTAFTFTISELPEDGSYTYYIYNAGQYVSTGTLTHENNTFVLQSGWNIRINAVPNGVYTITEVGVPEGYTPQNGASVTLDFRENPDGEELVYFRNVKQEEYTVTYDPNSTVQPDEIDGGKHKVGDVVTINEKPDEWKGHEFLGWKSSADGVTYKVGDTFVMPASDVTLEAQWNPMPYDIIYAGEGVNIEPGLAYYNDTVTLPEDEPTRNGYTFNGWKAAVADTDAVGADGVHGKTYAAGQSITMPASDVTLTAQWTINTYTVTYKDENGNTVGTVKVNHGGDVPADKIPKIPEKEGYTGAWNHDGKYIIKDTVINLKYTVKTYKVTYEVAYLGTVIKEFQVEHGGDVPEKEIPPVYERAGYTGEWEKDGKNITQDTAIKANYTPIEYTITFETDGGKSVANLPYTIESYYTALPSTTKDGYTFKGWKVKESSGNWKANDIVMDGTKLNGKYGNVTLIAQWDAVEYKIIYELDGGTNHADNRSTFKITDADFVLQNPTKEGYEFDGWSCSIATMFNGIEKNPTVETSCIEDITVTAHWTKLHKVTLDLNYENAPEAKTVEVRDNTAYTPGTPTGPEGYTFVGWYTEADCKNKVETPITVTADTTLYARWVRTELATGNIYVGVNIAYHVRNGVYKYEAGKVSTGSEASYHKFPQEPSRLDYRALRVYLLDGIWTGSPGDYAKPLPGIPGDYIDESMLDDTDNFKTYVEVSGVADNTGALVRAYVNLDWDGIVGAWIRTGLNNNISGTDIPWSKLAEGDYEVIPYVVKRHKDAWGSYQWYIDLLVLPKEEARFTLTYDINPADDYSGTEIETQWYGKDYTVNAANPVPITKTEDGLTYTARLKYWEDQVNNKQYNVGDTITMTQNITLTANWEYPVKYKVEHHLQNPNDDGYTIDSSRDSYSTGYVGEQTAAQSLSIDGYTAKSIAQAKIAEDNSTVVIVYYDRNQFKVSYQITGVTDSGYTIPATASYKWDAMVNVAAPPVMAGYTFSGWTTSDVAITDGSFTMPQKDVVLSATCTANGYTVQFNANGGSGTMEDQDFIYNVAQNLSPNAFTRTGYTFLGWSKDPNATIATYADKASVADLATEGTVTLYAVWKQNTYKVIYNVAGCPNAVTDSKLYHYGDTVTVSSGPSWDEIHKFAGWTYNGSTYNAGETITMGTSNIELTAKWEIRYTVEYYFEMLDGSWYKYNEENQVPTYGVAGEKTDAKIYPVTGFTPREVKQEVIAADGSTVVKIYYDRNSHNVNYVFTGDIPTDFTLRDSVASHMFGTEVAVPSIGTIPTGYSFEWSYEGVTDTDGSFIMPDNDVTVTGTWTHKAYEVTFKFDDSSLGLTAPETITGKYYEDTIDLTDAKYHPTKEGYTFLGWKMAGATEYISDTFKMPNSNVELVGYFERIQYTVSYNLANVKPQTEYPDQKAYHGESVTIYTAPTDDEKYKFVGWFTLPNGGGTEVIAGSEFIPYENTVLYADWTPQVYGVYYFNQLGTNEPEYVSVTAGIEWGANVSLPDVSVAGYQFVGWKLETFTQTPVPVTVTDNSFTMPTASVKAIALFEPVSTAQYTVYYQDANGSDLVTPKTVTGKTYGETYTETAVTIAGYQPDQTTKQVVAKLEDEQSRITFVYSPATFKLTYTGIGVTLTEEFHTYNSSFALLAAPTREGYTFTGWKDTQGNTTYNANANITMPPRDLTLEAQWSAIDYTVSYELVGDLPDGVTAPSGETKNIGNRVNIPTDFGKEIGYTFSWSVEPSVEYVADSNHMSFYMPAKDVKVTGTYSLIPYNITYVLDGGTNDAANPATYYVTDSISLNAPQKANYSFVGWKKADGTVVKSGEVAISKGTTGDQTFTAVWKLNTTSLTITVDGVDPDQNYIFAVKGTTLDGDTIELTVSVIADANGDGSRTIMGLPIPLGNYTVTETSNWTWRYTDDQSVAATKNADDTYSAPFTFVNVDNPYWLNDYSNNKYEPAKGGSE